MFTFNRNTWQLLLGIVILAIILVGAYAIYREYSFSSVLQDIQLISTKQIVIASLLCILNYYVLTLYDGTAFIYLGRKLPVPQISLAAFVSYTFSHNVGFAAVSGGAIRLRLYTLWGLAPSEVAQIFLFSGFHFWLGLVTLAGVTCLVDPFVFVHALHLPEYWGYSVGLLLLLPVLAYLYASARGWGRVTFREKEYRIPNFSLALRAIFVAAVDWTLAVSVLYALLPDSSDVTFMELMAAFFAGQIAGIISHVPGGLGVFETVVLFSIDSVSSHSALLGTLVLFRIIYYFCPFVLGVLALSAFELYRQRALARGVFDRIRVFEKPVRTVTPLVLSIALFIGGALLLFSGSTPAIPERLHWVANIFPLYLLETSHFINSLTGVGLLVLAWGINKRMSTAYRVTQWLIVAGIIVSLIKGVDYEEAIYLFLLFIALKVSKRHFYRKSTFLSVLGTRPLLAALAVVICALWLGLFSYKHVEYSQQLWWEFAVDEDAPRFLRALVGSAIVLAFMSLRILFKPANPGFRGCSERDRQDLLAILGKYDSSTGYLGMLGDKSLLFTEDRSSVLMYRQCGQSWIALGDPIGSEEGCQELIWRFRDLCDEYDGLCVFYQVSANNLPLYIDLGLRFMKIGEEAIVSLGDFTLEGSKGRENRYILRRVEKEGFVFRVLERSVITSSLLTELRSVSDMWLRSKKAREKGFSLGFFAEDYIQQFPIAVIERDGQVCAFANVVETPGKTELSIDLMRHLDNLPNGIMDYLFISMMQWGKVNGYHKFNLGMAPLSGLSTHRLAPTWSKLASLLYLHGESFYNFDGIRRYKEKFQPEWSPKYLAHPRGFVLPVVLANVSSVISGGLRGIVTK